ncbi:Transposase (plasmid) [Roseomonas mucosa]|uniref:Transposase n=1 Tax=Roseomonas mucosa TaxID=207340 RepID=A0A4Y1MR91_9PROT|nr:Transposase [Roseomonas mucosa]
MTSDRATYPGYRFPAEIISHAVWLHHVFSLSLRDVELILAKRGITVTHESIRNWCRKFGSQFAAKLWRRQPKPGDTWHLDEVFLRINGVLHYLWRAVDQHGVVLDILVQDQRNGSAAKRFFKRLLAGLKYKPRRLVTDGLKSYGVRSARTPTRGPASQQPTPEQSGRELASAHPATRAADAAVQVGRAGSAVPSAHSMIHGHFRPRRHLMTAGEHRRARTKALRI